MNRLGAGRRRLGLILALAASSFLLLGAVALTAASRGTDRIVQARDWVAHTSLVIRTAQEAEVAIRDAERDARGYLLTQDRDYLDIFNADLPVTPAIVGRLRALTADNPEQEQRLVRISALVQERLGRLTKLVELRRVDQLDTAHDTVGSGKGRRDMGALTAEFDRFKAAEDALLASRNAGAIAAENDAERGAVAATVIALAALGATGIAGLAGLRRALASERTLQATLDGLPQGVLAAGPDFRPVAWNARFAEVLHAPAIDPKTMALPAAATVTSLAARARDTGLAVTAITPLPDERSAELVVAPAGESGFIASVTDVTERLQSEAFNRHAQKMDAIGQMTGGLAHDFNNLLTVVMGSLERLGALVADQPQARRHVDLAMMGAERGAQLNRQLLAFARRQPLAPRVLEPRAVIDEIEPLVRRTLGERIEMRVIVQDGLWPVLTDRAQLESALLNLSLNARDAIEARHGELGGTLLIELANATFTDAYVAREFELEPGPYVMLAVTDDGTGMPPEVQARAFDPFFTTKEPGRGTGLGLSQIYGYAKQSGGHAKIYSEVGQGTTIKLFLPRASGLPVERRTPERVETRGAGERILVVEDDPGVRATVLGMLSDLGFATLEAQDGESGLAALDAAQGKVDLIFTDVVMPGAVSARTMSARAREKYPHIRVLYTSGYTENSVIHHGRLDADVQLLSKPYRRDELAARLRDVLG